LKAIFSAFDRALEQLKTYQAPNQIWIFISQHDSCQDTIYFHTPNPNQDNFPYHFDNFAWETRIPALLLPHINQKYEVGGALLDDETWYAVRVREHA
jgi:hypothetical protein